MRFAKLILIGFVFVLFLFSAYAFAAKEIMQNIINQGIRDSEAATKKLLVNSDNFRKEMKAAREANEKAKTFRDEMKLIRNKYINDLNNNQTKNFKRDVIQPIGACAVFVSFSMPEPSLKQIIIDADRYHVPVIIRGLYKNSLRETANKILALTKEKNKGGILINPVWFRKYDIKAVPVFLVTESRGGQDNSCDLVYGNIPLKRALTLLAEKGEYAKEAARILARVSDR
jgi:type-F conjugative transfer system pilin assembly protein TrbC